MEQPPNCVAYENHPRCVFCDELYTSSSRVYMLGLLSSMVLSSPLVSPSYPVEHIVLNKKTKDVIVILAVYVYDILLTKSDDTSIHPTKTYL